MAVDDAPYALLRVPLAESVALSDLSDLLNAIDSIARALALMDDVEGDGDAVPGSRHEPESVAAAFWVEELHIGTPNQVTIGGRTKQITAVMALVAAVIAVPKVIAEADKTHAEADKTRVEKVAAELDVIERARRLHMEKKISDAELSRVLDQLSVGSEALRRSSGVVRDEPKLLPDADTAEKKRMQQLLERARALGVHDAGVDMWLGVITGDIEVLRRALEAGADPNSTFDSTLQRIFPRIREDQQFRELFAKFILPSEPRGI